MRANPYLYHWSPRERAARPDPHTTGAGIHTIEFDDAWFHVDGRDQRLLAGRDLRYWLVQFLHTRPHSDHSVAELLAAIADAGFRLTGRPSKTVSDALHTETDRGRVQRTGWGRYQLAGPLPTTTAWRVRTRLERLRNNLERCIAYARKRLTVVWQHTLDHDYVVLPKHQPACEPSLLIHVFSPRVASPTESSENDLACSSPHPQRARRRPG